LQLINLLSTCYDNTENFVLKEVWEIWNL